MNRLIFLIVCLFPALAGAQVNLSSSLTACYALNGNANDPVSSLHGTLSSVTPTVDRFNNPNAAYRFNGSTSSVIELPNNPLIKPNAVSFSAWVRFETASAYYVVFASNNCSSYHEGYTLATFFNGGTYKFQAVKSMACSPSFQIGLTGVTSVSALTWYHVGFYIGSDSIKLYVNGALDAAMANSNPISYDPAKKVFLGGSGNIFDMPLYGSLDNVRFYNRKLNGSEFNQLYLQDPACLAIPSGSIPAVAFTVSTVSLCAGSSITLTDLSSNAPTTWNWQIPGGQPSSSPLQNPNISFPNPGTYTVSMVASNSVGASNTGTQSIVVLPNPVVNVTAASNSVCSGQSINLFASGANTYTWSTSQTGALINVSPGNSQSYAVTGKDLNGCTGLSNFFVNVLTSPAVFISSSSPGVCQGQSLTLNASGANSYTWSNFQNGSSIVVFPNGTSIYQVTGSNTNSCVASASISLNVNPLPSVVAMANKTLVCRGNPVILSGSGAQTYIWNNSVNSQNMQVNPNFNTSYTLVGTSTLGCSNNAIINIQVSECIGLNEFSAGPEITLSPNPTNTFVKLSFIKEKSGTLFLYNANAQLVFEKNLEAEIVVKLDLSSYPEGIYHLIFRNGAENFSKRIIKN